MRIGKIGVFIFFLIALFLTLKALVGITSSIAPDFGLMWYSAGDLLTQGNPYTNPNLFTIQAYPPNSLLFYLPLTFLNYSLAQGIFIFLSLLALAGSVFLALKIALGKVPLYILLLALSLALLSFPVKFTLGMGQCNFIALFLLLFSFLSYKKKNHQLAGILLGLSFTLKTIFVFFVLFYFLKKQGKVIIYSLIPLGIAFLLIALLSKFSLYQYYFTQIVPPLLNMAGREVYYNQGIMGFVSRITPGIDNRIIFSQAISLSLLALITNFALKRKNADLVFSAFVITLTLIDTLSMQHHFAFLIYPFIVLSALAVKAKKYIALVVIGISYLLISWNFKDISVLTGFSRSFMLSHVFYGAVLLLITNIYFLKEKK